jgi:hypothetical protein
MKKHRNMQIIYYTYLNKLYWRMDADQTTLIQAIYELDEPCGLPTDENMSW